MLVGVNQNQPVVGQVHCRTHKVKVAVGKGDGAGPPRPRTETVIGASRRPTSGSTWVRKKYGPFLGLDPIFHLHKAIGKLPYFCRSKLDGGAQGAEEGDAPT